jgi:hypothetical protein
MRRMVVQELVAHPERIDLNLRMESRPGFVRHVDWEFKVLVSTVHHRTAPFPHPPPVTLRAQVRLQSAVDGVVESSVGLRWPCRS